jgi:hypothetical protein
MVLLFEFRESHSLLFCLSGGPWTFLAALTTH